MFNVLSQDWNPTFPATSTTTAIAAGVYWAVAGGIKALVRQLTDKAGASHHRSIIITGGDALCLATVLGNEYHPWPAMTLEGIRLAAEALP
jgi:pantothenate kinase type III